MSKHHYFHAGECSRRNGQGFWGRKFPTESDDVVRVTLTFTSTSTSDQLSMDQLGPDNITYPEVFDDGTATHVVTGVEYGADVFFDFDKKVEKGSSNREIKGELQGAIETCKALLSVEGKMSAEIIIT